MPWYKKTIRSGALLEERRYFATRDGRRLPRSANREESGEEQQRYNQRSAEMELTRLIACNFAEGGASYVFGSDESLTELEAMKRERNLIDRIKRARKRLGLPPLMYIAVTEKQTSWHHHIIMQDDMPMTELEEIWQGEQRCRRSIYIRLIQQDPECYGEIARYMLGADKAAKNSASRENVKPERRKGQHRWHASKGLKRPVVEKVEIKRPPRIGEPKAPKGYRLLPTWQVGCDGFGNIYTYFAAVREDLGAVVQRRRNAGATQRGPGRSPGGLKGRALRAE